MLAAFLISPMTTVPSFTAPNERTCWLWAVILLLSELPFATVLTLVARAAGGPFRSRSTVFAVSQEGKDHPSWPTGALVPRDADPGASPAVECRPIRPVRADPPPEIIRTITTTGTTTINPAKGPASG